MAKERKTEKAIMKGKRQSQWFSFAKYTIFRYGLSKTRMVVTTLITDDCFWIAFYLKNNFSVLRQPLVMKETIL